MAMFAVTARLLAMMWAGCVCFKLSEPPLGQGSAAKEAASGYVEGAEDAQGDGVGLGKNLKFLLVKVAQLEALAEMQQAEIASHRLEIASLKKEQGKGLEVDPAKHLGILLEEMQTTGEGSKTRLDEATDVLKKVWGKQEYQRRTGKFHEGSFPHGWKQGVESNETAGLAAKEKRRFGPVGDVVKEGTKVFSGETPDVPDFATDPVGTIKKGYEEAKTLDEKVAYAKKMLTTHPIDTVETATELLQGVLSQSGFQDVWVKLHRPTLPSHVSGRLYLGKVKVEIKLISEIKTAELDLGSIDLPSQLKEVVGKPLWQIQGALSLGQDLSGCSNWHLPGNAVKCFGDKIIDQAAPLKEVVGKPLMHIQGALSLGRDLLGCSNWHLLGNAVKCFGDKIIDQAAPLKEVVGKPLTHIQGALSLGQNLLGCSNWDVPGNAVKCFADKIINQVPELSATAGGAVAAVQKMITVGKELTSCSEQSGSGIVECLGTKIIQHTPPFSFLNQMGDILSEFFEGFAKVAGTVARQVLKGSSSLIQEAALSKFPATGAPATVHHSGQSLLITKHTQKRQKGKLSMQMEGDDPPEDGIAFSLHDEGSNYQSKLITQLLCVTFRAAIEECMTVTYSVNVQPVIAFVGGVQIDVMPQILSSGVLLFSKTLRLAKRYKDPTDFIDYAGHLQSATANWEQGTSPQVAISRTKLLQTEAHQNHNQTPKAGSRKDEADQGVFEWMEDEDVYLASANYSQELGVNLTSELRGMEAKQRLSLEATKAQGVFQLFSFKHDGMVSFEFQAVMNGNDLEMRAKMGFGTFQSPLKTMKLVDIAQQFEVVLHALPFMSIASRSKALDALKDFTHHMPPPVVLRPGTTVALHNIFFQSYINADSTGQVRSCCAHAFELGLPPNNQNERWTVVDAGEGQIALHHPRYNGFLRLKASGLDLRHAAPKDFQAGSGWEAETFKVVNLGGGTGIFGLQNPATKRFVSVGPGHTYVTDPSDVLHAGWTHQQFRVEVLKPRLAPGTTVGLWSPMWKHWLRLNHADMDKGGNVMAHDKPNLAYQTDWEKFEVVDAGDGEVALWNPTFKAFVQIENGDAKASPPIYPRQLTTIWPSCRFQVVPTGDGTIALHNPAETQFLAMRMEPGAAGILTTGHTIQSLPETATSWERFVVYESCCWLVGNGRMVVIVVIIIPHSFIPY
ncbi:unnamed protein product [Symbiodinium sp. CCMP2592]|nr:unnamed protein product [Symbiodinium sp. CCMP2592]